MSREVVELKPKEPIDPRYPSFRYHRELEAKIVRSEREDKALGEGWADSPARFTEEQKGEGMPEARKPGRPKKVNA